MKKWFQGARLTYSAREGGHTCLQNREPDNRLGAKAGQAQYAEVTTFTVDVSPGAAGKGHAEGIAVTTVLSFQSPGVFSPELDTP